ncbi:hypothetical protein [Aquamicrobium terrae]|uniref:ABC-type branched-subunit amino acid transport system ATPase component n=1 Tax=Aquamicrobium terrae TaxID=1324945 RepID=A0ABV2N1N5_9HYPH
MSPHLDRVLTTPCEGVVIASLEALPEGLSNFMKDWDAYAVLGYVPQVRNVFGSMSLEDNFRMGLFAVPGSVKERQKVLRKIQ